MEEKNDDILTPRVSPRSSLELNNGRQPGVAPHRSNHHTRSMAAAWCAAKGGATKSGGLSYTNIWPPPTEKSNHKAKKNKKLEFFEIETVRFPNVPRDITPPGVLGSFQSTSELPRARHVSVAGEVVKGPIRPEPLRPQAVSHTDAFGGQKLPNSQHEQTGRKGSHQGVPQPGLLHSGKYTKRPLSDLDQKWLNHVEPKKKGWLKHF